MGDITGTGIRGNAVRSDSQERRLTLGEGGRKSAKTVQPGGRFAVCRFEPAYGALLSVLE